MKQPYEVTVRVIVEADCPKQASEDVSYCITTGFASLNTPNRVEHVEHEILDVKVTE